MTKALGAVLALLILSAAGFFKNAFPAGAGVQIKSGGAEIYLTGRQHTQFNTSSVDGEVGSEFLIRRARFTLEADVNEFVGGTVSPEFGRGELELKDAFLSLRLSPHLKVFSGQFKRPFDAFQLESSNKTLVIEREGDIRGAAVVSLSSLTRRLEYSDRDIGVMASISSSSDCLVIDAAVTNGSGADTIPTLGGKQFTGRIQIKPKSQRDLTVSLAAAARAVRGSCAAKSSYSRAAILDAEYGGLEEGLRARAGVAWGDNWRKDPGDPPHFLAIHTVAGYKHRVRPNRYLEAVEPVFRFSWADADRQTRGNSGYLFTPGVQLFFSELNKIALNLDVFVPESENEETEYSLKVQTYLVF